MKLLALASALSACVLLGGCPDGGGGNPRRLYLALRGSELDVQLVAEKPDPF